MNNSNVTMSHKQPRVEVHTKEILFQEFADFKLEHPTSHVGRYPNMLDSGHMKWIMVYAVEVKNEQL